MNTLSRMTVAAVLTLGCALVNAQTGPGPGPGPGRGPGPGASAPGSGMQHGPGPGGMRHHGGQWGPRHTMGWSMMSPAERDAHREKMRSMTHRDECTAYMAQHHEQMMARAKDKGHAMPAMPRRDGCAGLPTTKP